MESVRAYIELAIGKARYLVNATVGVLMPDRDPLTTNVVACRWQRTGERWRLWVSGRRGVFGEGETYEEAEEALIHAIMDAAPDLDAVIPMVPEFSPPLPASALAERYLTPELYVVKGDEVFEVHGRDIRISDLDRLFKEEMCGTCKNGRGQRTDVPIRVDYAPSGVDAGWIRAPFHNDIYVFSDRFLDLLSVEERGSLKFQPIEILEGTRRKFFELGGKPELSFVGVREFDADGLECTTCGHRSLDVMDPRLREGGTYLKQFICAADLPNPLPDCFTVGLGNEVNLCMTRKRWESLRGQLGTRAVLTERVGVVAEADCDRQPRIRNRLHRCEICEQWPEPRGTDNKRRSVFYLHESKCVLQNFTWLADAERNGLIRITRKTMEPMAIWDRVTRGERPKRTEFVSFRCPNCWRLATIVLNRKELILSWR